MQTNGTDINLWNSTDGEYLGRFIRNGAVELYYDSEKVFQTTATGIRVDNTNGNGEIRVRGSEGNGAQIYMDSDDADDNADQWRLDVAASDNSFGIQNYASGSWEKNIECNGNGNVELYHDNSVRAETMSTGFKILRSVDDSSTTLKLENNSTHNSQNPSVSIKVDLASGKNGGSIDFIRENNYQSTAAADSSIVFKPAKNDTPLEIVKITQDYVRLHSNSSGIQFNSDTADTNALDDYEEGSWTPTFEGTTTTGTVTYQARNGKYVKIGKLVTWEMYISYNNGNGAGYVHITGLPFTTASNSTYPAVNIGYVHNYTLRSDHILTGLHANDANYLYFYERPNGGGSNVQINYDGSGSLIMSGHYEAT